MKPTRHLKVALFVVFLAGSIFGSTALNSARLKTPQQKPKAKTAVVKATPFKPACANPSFPDPAPKKKLAIDSKCGLAGSGGKEGAQDTVKNNFCATGEPKVMTIPLMTDLQAQVEQDLSINFGDAAVGGRKRGPTTDRTPLQKLGEGELVTLQAFVLVAHQEGGESVNCGPIPGGALVHDIHISLVATKDAPPAPLGECAGVVAEMSPHHRPDSWTQLNVQRVAKAHLPVRVTGQLFFDSSHLPCKDGLEIRKNPRRISLWEIHPIYKFEVCTADCDGDAGTWLPLDQWAKLP